MKICNRCKMGKPVESFSWRNKSRATRQSYCKECRKVIDRDLYLNTDRPKQIAEGRKERKLRNQKWIIAFLNDKCCVDCQYSNIVALEFDHLYDKNKNISDMVLEGYSISTIESEITKCEIVCANCHKIRTSKRGNHYRTMLG